MRLTFSQLTPGALLRDDFVPNGVENSDADREMEAEARGRNYRAPCDLDGALMLQLPGAEREHEQEVRQRVARDCRGESDTIHVDHAWPPRKNRNHSSARTSSLVSSVPEMRSPSVRRQRSGFSVRSVIGGGSSGDISG